MDSPAPAPGWYPDPAGRYDHRYFDGAVWTADVSRGGQRYVDVTDWERQPRPSDAPRYKAATWTLVLGLLAVTTAWMPLFFVVGAVLAVIAIVLGMVVRRRRPPDPRGFATAGMCLGGVALALCVVGVLLTRWVFQLIDEFENPPATEVTLTSCAAVDGGVAIAGTIEHDAEAAHDFRIEVDVGNEDRVTVVLHEVAPGEAQQFDEWVAADGGRSAELRCDVHRVTGPAPFGVVPT